jgi:hypothetical protein
MKLTAIQAQAKSDDIVRAMKGVDRSIGKARSLLHEFHAGEGWRAMGYDSPKHWASNVLVRELDVGRNYAYRLLGAVEVAADLELPMGNSAEIPERVLRPLTRVEPKDRPRVWHEAEKHAGSRGDDTVSSQDTAAAAREYLGVAPRAAAGREVVVTGADVQPADDGTVACPLCGGCGRFARPTEMVVRDDLGPIMRDWLTYKQARREGYSPVGMQKLIVRMHKVAEAQGPDAVIDAMELAMSSGWKGWEHGNTGAVANGPDPWKGVRDDSDHVE